MSRIIRIKSCDDCPSRDHKGGFGSPAYVPRCNKTRPSRELPYTKSVSGNRVIATQTPGIPDWCPLERDPSEPLPKPEAAPTKPIGHTCDYVSDPQPDNKYQSKCHTCGDTLPF